MPFCLKATRDSLKTCAAVATLGAVLAPSNALAVTTWNWSFTATGYSGSGTFTTADVTPAANTTYNITGITGTINSNSIIGLDTSVTNMFRWNGTSTSPILVYRDPNPYPIAFLIGFETWYFGRYGTTVGWEPMSKLEDTDDDYPVSSSSLAPVSPPAPSTAAPGPLPLLGAAAAFQASRRLRRRLSGSLPAA
jgi:hypothetical protein